ncbi:5-oxoprolinase subunit PxpA [Microcella humidisoli]|uniref:5-oxoprolinase subunit A n=1 Tax=Microcella humidisoli TaxID=2963406 RepID=A0ABY5FT52_9MICO|nr:5-oxoprolinase subunit PxpA [Microcella humidisoli]UTT61471.1 LamB/YcsF family protein [Microcella humidisoli]
MVTVDLNSDLGESFGAWTMGDDAAMFPLVTSANLACGFHAGDPATMLASCRAAARHGVAITAHPAYRDLAGFGRRDMEVPAEHLHADVLYQVSALAGIAAHAGAAVRSLKPHGALYNRIAVDLEVAEVVADVARGLGLPVLGLPGSAIETACRAVDVRFVPEAFVDRGYLADGTLAPRGLSGALLTDPEQVAERAVRMVVEGVVVAIDGTELTVHPESLCVHGDTPGAVAIARAVRAALDAAGVEVAAVV